MKAKIPNPRQIKVPGPEVPDRIKGLSGRWIGWAGRSGSDRSASVAVDVEELTTKGGTLVYFFAAPDFTTAYEYRFPATLVNGNELEGSLGGGTSVKLRLRPDGNADFMVWWSARSRYGVLTRQ